MSAPIAFGDNQFEFGTGAAGPEVAKFVNAGDSITGTVVEVSSPLQCKVFNSQDTEYFGKSGDPKMQLIVTLNTAAGLRRLFVKTFALNKRQGLADQLNPVGAMAKAVIAAYVSVGMPPLQLGTTLTVTHTGTAAPAGPGVSGAKLFSAVAQVATPAGPPTVPAPKPVTPAGPPVASAADDAIAALV